MKELTGDEDAAKAINIKTTLPWQEVTSSEIGKDIRKHIFSLPKEDDLLCREEDELELEFNFQMELYSYQAVVLSKLDKNLQDAHGRLVPDQIGEISFWRNYFYEIEKYFQEKGQYSRIG